MGSLEMSATGGQSAQALLVALVGAACHFGKATPCLTRITVTLSLALAGVNSVQATPGLRDLTKFPACVTDQDCKAEDGYKCFQYMCYPWNRSSREHKGAFRSCSKSSDCNALEPEEGGDGKNADCYRHQDRRNVFTGLCFPKSEMKQCFSHGDCAASGLKCVNQICGDPAYLEAIRDLGCEQDNLCDDMLLGDHCCFDISGGLEGWNTGQADWGKKCCNNSKSPVIPPSPEINEKQIEKLNLRVKQNFAVMQLDGMICRSLDYTLMLKVEACNQFRTTTTTTTTTKRPKPTPKKVGLGPSPSLAATTLSSPLSFLLLVVALLSS